MLLPEYRHHGRLWLDHENLTRRPFLVPPCSGSGNTVTKVLRSATSLTPWELRARACTMRMGTNDPYSGARSTIISIGVFVNESSVSRVIFCHGRLSRLFSTKS